MKSGQVMATLEIPELQAQLQQDQAEIKSATDQMDRAEHELKRYDAQYNALHLQYTRLNGVFENQPGIVGPARSRRRARQRPGGSLASGCPVNPLAGGAKRASVAQTRLLHDQALFDYSKIIAPFAGVVTERYANLGTLMQAGTSSSTQALPLVQLSEDDLFRLVIPIPESLVRYIRVGDPVNVSVPALNRSFPGKVARFSLDVEDTHHAH